MSNRLSLHMYAQGKYGAGLEVYATLGHVLNTWSIVDSSQQTSSCPFSLRDGSRQGTAINHQHMVVLSLVWSCVMVLITFKLANLLVLSYSQGTRTLTGMAAGFYCGQNKTQLLWHRLSVTSPLYVCICVYKILSMLPYGLWHPLHGTTTSARRNRSLRNPYHFILFGMSIVAQVAWESVKWSWINESVYSLHQDQEVLWWLDLNCFNWLSWQVMPFVCLQLRRGVYFFKVPGGTLDGPEKRGFSVMICVACITVGSCLLPGTVATAPF